MIMRVNNLLAASGIALSMGGGAHAQVIDWAKIELHLLPWIRCLAARGHLPVKPAS
jgi:hypothetical protein